MSADERERVFKIVQEGGGTRGLEVEFRNREGTPIHTLYSTNIVDIRGKPHLLTVIEDITKRKEAEDELRKSERVLHERQETIRALVETSRDWIWAINPQGIHTYSNPAVEDILGHRPEELIGNPSLDFMHEDDRKRVEEMLPACIADKKGWNNLLIRWRHKDGSWRYLESNAVQILNAEGDLTGFQGVDRDITERKKAEEELRVSEGEFRAVFDQSPQLTGVLSLDGTLVKANQTALDFAGVAVEDVIGKLFWETPWWSHSSKERARIREAVMKAATGKVVDLETSHPDAQGRVRDIYVRLGPLRHADGSVIGIVPFGVDITDLKSAERELLANREQLRELAGELSATEERERRSIATYLHDQIGQSLAVAQMKFGALSEEAGVEHLTESIEYIGALLDKVMDDTRTLTFNLSPPILYELGFSAALESFGERTAQEHGLQFTYSDDGRPKPLDSEDSALVFRNARELMMNVVKHAEADRLTASLSVNGGDLLVTIEDDGVGFDVSDISRGGRITRFGLFSIKERMHFIGGRLEIESSPGKGTRATLSLPLHAENDPGKGT
jgi:PAS domain S-box-containing protein